MLSLVYLIKGPWCDLCLQSHRRREDLASSFEEAKFDIKHTAPQHRQYLEYGVRIPLKSPLFMYSLVYVNNSVFISICLYTFLYVQRVNWFEVHLCVRL